MIGLRRIVSGLMGLCLVIHVLVAQVQAQSVAPVRRGCGLERGVNFGNMLEAPAEGLFGLFVQPEYFDKAVEAGFDHIRLPVSWDTHALLEAPYTIDPVFLARVDWCIDQAISRQLKVILDVHHYDALNDNPLAEWERALAIWDQIARHYRNRGGRLLFEVLNEPHGEFSRVPELWNLFVKDALAVIRKSNPTRRVLVGPTLWNSAFALGAFEPPLDANLVLTIHCYSPFLFTHQGAGWVTPLNPTGVTFQPAAFDMALPWDNWSWDSNIRSLETGLGVTFQRGYAGLFFHTDEPIRQADELEFAANKPLKLRVHVGNELQSQKVTLTTAASKVYRVAIDPKITPITEVFIQNDTANGVPEWQLLKLNLIVGQTRLPMIVPKRMNLLREFEIAAEWANARQMPLHLGEFGAYEMGDMESRVAWTRTVRAHCERLNISWSYWELAYGFGIYNPEDGQWRLSLLNALNPQFSASR